MDESAAIQALLEKESTTWRAGDFKAHADCWHIRDYSKILVSTTSARREKAGGKAQRVR